MSLDVYLYGERVGTLFPAGDNDYRLAYDPELVDRVGPGRALLSNSLPARPQPYSAEATRAYVEGLLPEGPRRTRLGRELDLDATDGYLLLAELGHDCAGAVTFVPAGERPQPRDAASIAWLSEDELAEVLKPPPPRLFSEECEQRMRFALPGVRHKLSLIRDEAGDRWGWPEAGAPSTHVVKPETGEYPEYVANEMFCMTVCRQVGIPVAKASVAEIAGRRCLVSPRYDRLVSDGSLEVGRLHCESFCQALGIPPVADSESPEGKAPGWTEARGLLNAVSRPDEIVNLLTAAFCNYILGNGDAHGRNFALISRERTALSGPDKKWRLAPLTDITSTVVYDDPVHHGLVISEEYQETSYLLELAEVCEECEFDFEVLRGLASTTATRVGMAVETIATRSKKEGWHEPIVDKIVELAADRSFGLGAEVEY
ncbi:MAG TPA: HipA domain-containing protein [Solirubrobacterales bacterium]|nr:HipA domain-containing protein [Solirubrobacterales bacterium]